MRELTILTVVTERIIDYDPFALSAQKLRLKVGFRLRTVWSVKFRSGLD
jgi:hypothetical protein